jgi:hypothetical protein
MTKAKGSAGPIGLTVACLLVVAVGAFTLSGARDVRAGQWSVGVRPWPFKHGKQVRRVITIAGQHGNQQMSDEKRFLCFALVKHTPVTGFLFTVPPTRTEKTGFVFENPPVVAEGDKGAFSVLQAGQLADPRQAR